MKLYHWHSEYLADWQFGDIIVMAESVEQARAKVLAMFERQEAEHKEFDPEWYEEKLSLIKRDLDREPDDTRDIWFIHGSA